MDFPERTKTSMSETVRAFLAVELRKETKGDLRTIVDLLRRARIDGLRAVNPDTIHLTLKFLGDIETSDVGPITSALSDLAKTQHPFSVELGGVGVFPSPGDARVLWVGIEKNVNLLRELQHCIDDVTERLGYPKERIVYRPHLTLARLSDKISVLQRRRAVETLFSVEVIAGLGIDVHAVSLIQSVPLPKGVQYHQLAYVPLLGNSTQ